MKRNSIKRAVILSLAGVMTVSGLTGCGKDKGKNASARKVVEYNIEDYVTLGTYTGLDVEEKITEVTDQDIEDALQSLISDKTTYEDVTDRNILQGDQVTLDYTKSVEGEEDVNQTDYTLTIGDAGMGTEFDNHLIGMAVNASETFTIKETASDMPEGASLDSEAGETNETEAMYTVSIKSIKQPVVPELTDSFIAENTDYETIDAYRTGKRKEMEETNADRAKSNTQSELLDKIMEASEVSGCPAFVYNINYNSIVRYYQMYSNYFNGGDLETYMKSAGVTFEDLQNQAVDATKQTLVIEAIVKDAGIDITDEQLDAKIDEYAENYGSRKKVLEAMSKEELLIDMRSEAAMDYIYENNNVKQVTVSADAS